MVVRAAASPLSAQVVQGAPCWCWLLVLGAVPVRVQVVQGDSADCWGWLLVRGASAWCPS